MRAVWKNLGFESFESFAAQLRQMYLADKMSQKMIADAFGCHSTTIENSFAKCGLQGAKSRSEALLHAYDRERIPFSFTTRQLEILDGLMLGDGHLEISNTGHTARYRHACKYRYTLESICADLSSLRFCDIWKYDGYWWVNSGYCPELAPIRKRWYPKGKKRLPKDFVMTPLAAYHFFVGDGCASSTRHDLIIAADDFTASECQVMCRQFAEHGIAATSNMTRNRIRIAPGDIDAFFAFIGECKNPEYQYKWNFIRPKWTFKRKFLRGPKCQKSLSLAE